MRNTQPYLPLVFVRRLTLKIPPVEDAITHGTPNLQRPLTKAAGLYGLAPNAMERGDVIYLPGFKFVGIRAVQYKLSRSNLLNGAEAVRHAWIHREDLRAYGATPYHSSDVISPI